MDNKIKELISKLQAKLSKYQHEIALINKKVAALKNQAASDQKLSTEAEQELKDLRVKLVACSQEKDEIEKELADRVSELENSNLANREKQQQIQQLLTASRSELEVVNRSLLAT
ncbi:MAG: hypothetical protein NY202_03060 [Mollicutes bacterium UO1]